MIDQVKIGRFLKELRKEKELTQEQLAEKQLVVRRKCIVTFVGTMAFALCIMIGYLVFPTLPEDSFLRSDGLWLGIGILGLALLWGIVIHENRKNAVKSE